MGYCQKCGARYGIGDNFCPECGIKLGEKVKEEGTYSLTAAVILGFFFGPLGYIYVRRYLRVLLGIIAAIVLLAITQGKAVLALPILFALDCYRIAKKSQQP